MFKSVGQTSHSILLLPTQQWWVPGGAKIGELWMALVAENALNSPQRRPHKREFQYQGCELWSLLNSRGYQPTVKHRPTHLHLLRSTFDDPCIGPCMWPSKTILNTFGGFICASSEYQPLQAWHATCLLALNVSCVFLILCCIIDESQCF